MLIRMVRTKVLALLLGPAGIGLEAMYDSVVSLSRTLFDLGISSSGVRQIASAVGSGDERLISTTVFSLRRACLVLGLLGGAALFLARGTVSRLAFGNTDYATEIGWLSVMLPLGIVTAGQGTLLQGMRRIGDLARMNILGTLLGAAVSIPVVYVWGKEGIPAYMIVGAAVGCLVSWLYARRIDIARVTLTGSGILKEAGGLLQLGLAFLASTLMSTGTLFLLRVLVTRTQGVEGAGEFQAASSLSVVYVGFILQAMGTDFYPRLTAVAADNQHCNQMVNEQAEISFLLALPGVLGTMAFAPWVILVFYSGKFGVAADILTWQMAGMFLRLVSWPMGYILLAKGRGTLFVLTDAAAWTVYLGLSWVGLQHFGLPGIGMAFLGLYLFHAGLIYMVVRKATGFRWSSANIQLGAIGIGSVGAALYARLALSEPWGTGVGLVLALATGIYCLKILVRLTGVDRIELVLRKLRLPVPWAFRRR